MKRRLLSLALLAFFLLTVGSFIHAANKPPQKGGTLPAMSLPIPKSPAEKNYLGLSGEGSFKIPQIKAKVVIIEIFSMYCPFCQKEAPNINRLHRLIEENPDLKGKIKLIGIGAGNSSYEVGIFKTRYGVSFPLFPDGEYAVHSLLGSVRTPYFIAVKINGDGTHRIIYSKLGAFEAPESFLRLIVKSAGL